MRERGRGVQTRFLVTAVAVLAGCGVGGVIYAGGHARGGNSGGGGDAQQQTEAEKSKGAQSTTLNDQTDLNVTVYNSNIALVRDVRQLTLPSGTFSLKFADIAATVNPATVHFRSLTDPDKLSVIEQNYEYDLLDPAKLLHKYVGKEVTLVRSFRENGETKHEEVKATLLADNNGPVWKIGNDIVTGGYNESYRFPEVPPNLYERPTLLMSLENSGARKQQIEASYLAGNLSWNADYILTVGREDKAADLDGWVTLANTSGTAFHNARLQLVAGELNRLPVSGRMAGEYGAGDRWQHGEEGSAVPAGEFQRVSPVHAGAADFRRGQRDEADQPAARDRRADREDFHRERAELLLPQRAESGLAAERSRCWCITNSKMSRKPGWACRCRPGMCACTRKIRRAECCSSAKTASITRPKDETVTVHIGNAFDIVAERKQTDYKRIDEHTWEMEFEITLRNHKDTPVVVEVNEPIGGDWEMLSSTYKATKTAAFAAQFHVPVEKDGTSVLKYRIRAKW